MKKKRPQPLIGRILKKVAPSIGARVTLEPEWNVAGQIRFRSGKRSYFRFNSIGINTLGASEISKDKDYAAFFMHKLGYRVVPGKTFFRNDFAKILRSKRTIKAACAYAKKLGFPVVAKPNDQSQGRNVFLAYSDKELRRALRSIFRTGRIALVQPFIRGEDYRLVVLDSKIISAYRRIPLNVMGDGRSSISELLRKKQRRFIVEGRDTKLHIDPRMRSKLKRQQLSLGSVLPKGERVELLDNANLSTGGDAVDVTGSIHPSLKKIAVNVTKDMGLRLCGVDLLVVGNIDRKPKEYRILEINAAPGLDHYAQSGKAQERIVEKLYLQVLKAMSKS
jgi:D-alanine-D-alanine ligase-like ATP-grasp enzyme